MQTGRRQQLQIVFRNPNRTSMLKCGEGSLFKETRSNANSSKVSTELLTTSALSPTLSSMVNALQRLEQQAPLTLAAVHRFVVQQLGGEAGSGPFAELTIEEPPSAPPWGWRGRKA